MKKLEYKIFSEANNLENINFSSNFIESIHKLAFNGLPNLQGVCLDNNNIKHLHPQTFSSIAKLNILELSGRNHCVNEKFSNANQKLHEIEGKISRQCEYEPFPDEALVTQNLMDDANRRIDLDEIKIKMQETKLTEANDKINNLMKESQGNQEKWQKLEEMVKNFKEMETKISSLEDKHMKKLNDQQKEFDAMISSERVNIDAKITEMETKLST